MNFSKFRGRQTGEAVNTSSFLKSSKAGFDQNDHFLTLCSGVDSERVFVAITSKENK